MKLLEFNSIYEKLFRRYCNGGFATRIIGLRKVYLIFNPKSAQVILEHSKNINKADLYKCFVPWLGDSLFLSSGEKWKKRRKLLMPAFHFCILENFLPVMDEQSRIMVDKLMELKDKEWIDFTPLMARCALDIICETAMGIQMNVQNQGSLEYVDALDFVREIITKRIFERAVIPNFLFYVSAEGRKFKKCIKIMNSFTMRVIEARKKILENKKNEKKISKEDQYLNIKQRKPFLDTVLDCYFKDPFFTLEDVKEEVDIFMFAGHDTTTYGLIWICYLLGNNQHVQQKLIKEVDEVFGGDIERNITHDDIKKMKYMECVIKESSRIYTPVPMIGRKLTESIEIDGKKIPKGSNCGVMIHYIHRNAQEFPDPESFEPNRFLQENCVKRHPYSYIPFSAGPRNCIGMSLNRA
ncbi:cytochrome P450 4C1-like [Centruroides sculpturatus]|uniref:cytochrome P450 4C1-like n=1 Tax=Centruroides sculpturatus TaxID=218467 RepID=UPI000C6D7DE7|nr:cytochrome P450 4C1-like [Centruroides sculpturatus]